MQTVFSHIVQRRFSQVNEDVATDALAFILHFSESARTGMLKLLRGIASDIPILRFHTQQTEGSIRPDMWGVDETGPRVFVENKFWAGLTENQPISYLKQLAEYSQPTILLAVVPEARQDTVWHEFIRRLDSAGISKTDRDLPAGIKYSITTGAGPILALTSWGKLLSAMELEVADDQSAKSDLLQLRALCEAADSDAFVPISPEETTDQRTPAFVLQLASIVQASVNLAVAEGILNTNKLLPRASWERIGRYARLSSERGAGIWLGIHFGLWTKHGRTPLWLVFSSTDFGRASDVRSLIEPWASKNGIVTTWENNDFAVAIDIPVREDKDQVVRAIVDRLKMIGSILSTLQPRAVGIV